MSRPTKTLVAGIGNIFLGDDAFGCEVSRRLADMPLPQGVDVVDFGIRGMDLAYALSEGLHGRALLVDAAELDAPPGTLRVILPDLPAAADAAAANDDDTGAAALSPHGMTPDRVLQLVQTLGSRAPELLVLLCQPAWLGGEEGHMGLSPAVADAVPKACDEILRLLAMPCWQGGGQPLPHSGQRAPANPDSGRSGVLEV